MFVYNGSIMPGYLNGQALDITSVFEAIGAYRAGKITLDDMRKGVELIAGKAVVEASGGVNQNTVRAIAETGVDVISVGALTHQIHSLDLGLDVAIS